MPVSSLDHVVAIAVGDYHSLAVRSDGTALYHLATVVDDHDFEISHVIRAEEHLSNTPRQLCMARTPTGRRGIGCASPR